MTQTLCDDRLSFMPLYMTDSVRNNIWLPPALRTENNYSELVVLVCLYYMGPWTILLSQN